MANATDTPVYIVVSTFNNESETHGMFFDDERARATADAVRKQLAKDFREENGVKADFTDRVAVKKDYIYN